MIEKALILPVSTPVHVELSADEKGLLSVGIRINGGNVNVLDKGVTVPKADSSMSWSTTIGELV